MIVSNESAREEYDGPPVFDEEPADHEEEMEENPSKE